MNRISCFLFAICCLSSFGQTNPTSDIKQSDIDNLVEETQREQQLEKSQDLCVTNSSMATMMPTNEISYVRQSLSEMELSDFSDTPNYAFSYRRSDLFPGRIDPELYKRLEAAGCLTPHPPPPDNAFTRAMSIFEPEVVHLGQFDVSCSLITAIKRKNPLCLLNPMVLNVAW